MQLLPFLIISLFIYFFAGFFLFVHKFPSLHLSTCIAGVHFFSFSFFSFYWSMLLFLLHYSLAFVHYPIVRSLISSFAHYPIIHSVVLYSHTQAGVFLRGGVRKKEKIWGRLELGVFIVIFVIFILKIYCYVSQRGGTNTVLYEYCVGCLVDGLVWCALPREKSPIG